MLCLNRMAVILFTKGPLLEWLHSIDPTSRDLTLRDLNLEPSVYLLTESYSDEEAARHVRRCYKAMFEAELDGWWRQRSDWPRNLTYGLFTEWFDWQYHSVVLDLAKDPLIGEEV